MSIINIYSIIDPIKNELAYKAQQIVNDVTNRVRNIINDITFGLELRVGWVINGVKNHLENVINGIRDTVNYTRHIIENKINEVKGMIGNIVSSIVDGVRDLKNIIFGIVNTITHNVQNKIEQIKFELSSIIQGAINTSRYFIEGKIQGVRDKLESSERYIVDRVNAVKVSIDNKIDFLKSDVTNKVNEIKISVQSKVDEIKLSVSNKINEVRDSIQARIDSYKNIVTDKINETREYLRNTFDYAKTQIENKISSIKESINDFISRQVEQLRNKFNTTLESVQSFLRDRIEDIRLRIDTLKQDVEKRISKLVQDIEKRLKEWYEIIRVEFEGQFEDFSRVFSKLSNNEYTSYDAFIADFNKLGGQGGILSLLFGIIVSGSTYLNAAMVIGQPMAQNMRNLAMSEFTPSLLSPATVIELMAKDKISDDRALKELALNGLNPERAKLLKDSYETILSPGDIQLAFLRGEISEKDHDILLRRLQYSDASIALFKQLYVIIPPISDLITMSVREVFSPETTEKFGQFEDFPTEFAGFAKLQGLSEDWAKRYWAAHWSLPSATQGFEMLHRREIDEKELMMLLKALDVMPFWREKLMAISYNPLTRVDVRRMHKVGVLTEQQVYWSYRDIGYNDENAKRLTEFTVKLNSAENAPQSQQVRELTRSIIEQAYTRGIISKDEAINRLVGIKYTLSDAEFLIRIQDGIKQVQSTPDLTSDIRKRTFDMILNAYATRSIPKNDAIFQLRQLGLTELEATLEVDNIDYAISLKLKQRYVDSVQDLYTNWTIDKAQLFVYLNDLGFNQGEIEQLVLELDILRDTRTKLPTKEDLKRWVKGGITTVEQYINDLKGQGFADIYIERYVMELGEQN